MTLPILHYFQLLCYVVSLKRGVHGLPAFRQKYCKCVLVAVESQIFSDEFIYDEILVREIGSRGRCIVKSAKNFSSDFGSDLGEHSPFF